MNKYWTGVSRPGRPGTDEINYQCCELDYQKPQTGMNPLPSAYKDDKGKVSFYTKNQNRWLRMNDNQVDYKSNTYGQSERFVLIPTRHEKGLYKLVNWQGKEMACESDSSSNMTGDMVKDTRSKEWQFIPKGDGFAIYNPFTQFFIGNDGDMGACVEQHLENAYTFIGAKRPMADKFRLASIPILFRTEFTAD